MCEKTYWPWVSVMISLQPQLIWLWHWGANCVLCFDNLGLITWVNLHSDIGGEEENRMRGSIEGEHLFLLCYLRLLSQLWLNNTFHTSTWAMHKLVELAQFVKSTVMCLCVCICKCICICVCMCVCTWCVCVSKHISKHIHIYKHISINIYIYTNIYI